MTFNVTAKILLSLAAVATLCAPARAVTRWIPLPVPKALVLDESQSRPDVSRGAAVYGNCKACHDIGVNADTRVGPHLTGIVGRPAADIEGYSYSEAMSTAREEGLVWSPSLLDQYLAAPTGFLPGNKMAYVGLSDAAARRDLIAYLATFDLPESEPAAVDGDEQSATEAAEPSADQQP